MLISFVLIVPKEPMGTMAAFESTSRKDVKEYIIQKHIPILLLDVYLRDRIETCRLNVLAESLPM